MNMHPMAECRDGWRARAVRVAVLALLLALGSLLLGASPVLAAPVSFTGPTNFAAGDRPNSVAVGDFNGDSDPDLAVANLGSDNVSELLGGAGGGCANLSNLGIGIGHISVGVGELQGDSDPDLAGPKLS